MVGLRDFAPRRLFKHLGFAFVGSVLLAGCGETAGVPDAKPDAPLHPVKGKVAGVGTGSLGGSKIHFIPAQLGSGAREAIGELAADGSFELTTVTNGDGVAEGNYKIRLTPPPTQPGVKAARSPIPDRFLDEDGSGLTATITPTTTTLPPLKLTAAPLASSRDRD